MPRFIFVAGGVMSGIGKGVAVASIARILKSKGFKVTAVKIDPYINVDAGTMNPIEHGEVFVTEDGDECDQDIGNYERFLDENIYKTNYITTGRVYQAVINRERNLEYNGKCVEVVPDIPNEAISRIQKSARLPKLSSQAASRPARKSEADFVLIEIGGTVGEYQNMLFLEAARMMKLSHPKNVLFILVSYLPIPSTMAGEMKTKPTQTAVRSLNTAGIQPDIILARASLPLDEPRKKKISIFGNVLKEDVISAPDTKIIYDIPLNFEKENLGNRILKKFNLRPKESDLKDWQGLINKINRIEQSAKIGIVGKYFETGAFTLQDSYISVIEAIKHASWAANRTPEIFWLSADHFEQKDSLEELKQYDGIIVPGGFGTRGVEGKINTIEYCRKQNIPFLGLCYGLQLAVVEFSRNTVGLKNAASTEFSPKTPYPVIDVMPEQQSLLKEKKYGGTMRLGAYNCELKQGTRSWLAYGKQNIISERHRHRYEVNNDFREKLEKNGLVVAGVNPERNLIEIIELPNHPFFVATQFHPEFKSRPLNPHPLFREFIKSAIKK